MTNGPFEMRHEEGGYVEFLNEDVPTIVREIDGRVAILTTLEQPRKVVGYRVYDPGSSPSEVFGSAAPAGVVKPPFEFDRYINGKLMAEGVTVEKAKSFEEAMVAAARLASRGPNGEVPVLVLRPPSPQPRETVPASLKGDEQ